MKNLIFRYCTSATSDKVIPRWEQDYRLQPYAKLGLFYEYLEMGRRRTVPHVPLHNPTVRNTLIRGHVQQIIDMNMRNVDCEVLGL